MLLFTLYMLLFIKMAKLLAFLPVATTAVFTPQGDRAADCVVQVPDIAIVKTHDTGISLHHEDGHTSRRQITATQTMWLLPWRSVRRINGSTRLDSHTTQDFPR
jgi:hypothetical protein